MPVVKNMVWEKLLVGANRLSADCGSTDLVTFTHLTFFLHFPPWLTVFFPVSPPAGWTQCTTSCGPGYQMRAVKCVVGSYGAVMDDTECNAATRPTDTQVRKTLNSLLFLSERFILFFSFSRLMFSSLWRRGRCKVGASDSLIKEAQKAAVIHSKHTFSSHLVSIEQQYAVGSGPVELGRTGWCVMQASLYPQFLRCGCVTLLGVAVNYRFCCSIRQQSTLFLHLLTYSSFILWCANASCWFCDF